MKPEEILGEALRVLREGGTILYPTDTVWGLGCDATNPAAVAKIFENDLKSQYDPEGEDRDLEELVQIWQAGEFKNLYWSVFWEDPPVVEVPESYFR